MAFYKGEENMRKYEQSKEKLETVDRDVSDNLKRMAFHVVTPDFNIYAQAEAKTSYHEEDDIEERIERVKAEEMLEAWKRLVVLRKLELGYDAERDLDDDQIENLKEELFVQFGEDVEDVWIAFKHYKLNPDVSDKDFKRYSNV